MKLVNHFDDFLTDVVNLNSTRVTQLENSIEAIKDAIRDSDWHPTIKYFVAQGSWAHKTIIKPVDNGAFDADLLVLVDPIEGWSAQEYLSSLRAVFADNATYQDKVRRFSHCVTIEYAGERKIDIAPCVVGHNGLPQFEVCNFNTNEFELSEPEKYTAWLRERNSWTGGHALRKVTRLLKYLRDIKQTFSCQSVLMTTLLGSRISVLDSLDTESFCDVPTALKTIINRLDDWLQLNPTKPTVANPVLQSETFSGLWDDARYQTFRDKIHTYRSWVDDAFNEPDRDESVGKWRRVFGDDFAKSVVVEKAERISADALNLVTSTSLTAPGFIGDLVILFSRFGRKALPENFDRLPHKQRPKWRPLPRPLFDVIVTARRHSARERGTWIDTIASGAGPLPKHQWLEFQTRTTVGGLISSDFSVHWRVTNTDEAATKAACLRGGFEEPNDGNSRWEQLAYRGVHSVEAFIVRNRDQALVAQSDPFYVVIE